MKEQVNQRFYNQISFPSNVQAMKNNSDTQELKELFICEPFSKYLLEDNFIQPRGDWENFKQRDREHFKIHK